MCTRVLGLHMSLFALFLSATSLIPQKGLGPWNGCAYPIIFSCSQNQAMKSKDVIWENVTWPGFAKRALWACPELTQLLNLLSFGFGVCWTEGIITAGLNKVIWSEGRTVTPSSRRVPLFQGVVISVRQEFCKPSFSRRPSDHRRQYPVCWETSCFLIKFSYTQNYGNIFKGIIPGRFPVIQHFQTYPNGFWNICCLLRAAFWMR